MRTVRYVNIIIVLSLFLANQSVFAVSVRPQEMSRRDQWVEDNFKPVRQAAILQPEVTAEPERGITVIYNHEGAAL